MLLSPFLRAGMPSSGFFVQTLAFPHHQKRCMSRHKAKGHYDILKIPMKSTQAQVKSAYFVLSKKYHPDMDPSAEAKVIFADIQTAYEVLGNLTKRRQYDRQFQSHTANGPVTEINHPFDINSFKRQQFSSKKGVYKMGQTDVYNYDEFYHHHYGDSIGKMKSAKTASDSQNEKDGIRQSQRYKYAAVVYGVIILAAILGRKNFW